MSWRTRSIGELCDQSGGIVQTGPFGSQLKQSEYIEDSNGVPVVMPKDIKEGAIDESEIARIPEAKANALSRHMLAKGNIVFPRRGEISKRGYIKEDDKYFCGTGCLKIHMPDNEVLNKYLFYYLDQDHVVKWLEGRAIGSTMLNLNTSIMRSVNIYYPDLQSQEKIVNTLSEYDDLIENNKRRIELLEESARQLYKEWFVRFRFPGHEHVKITDGVPEGWANKPLEKYLQIKHGYAFKGEFFSDVDTSIVLMTPGNFKVGGGVKLDKKKYYSNDGPIPNEYVLQESDLLVTMTDLSKSSDTLGYPMLVPKPAGQIYLHNQRLGKVTSKRNGYFPKYYFYFVLQDVRYRAFVVGSASGTSVKHTSPKKILSYTHIMPENIECSLVRQFDSYAYGIQKQINTLISWNFNLTKARDLLLPKLMNGEITV